MHRIVIVAGLLVVAGCADLRDATTGRVQSYDGNTVVISGPPATSPNARPPAAMVVLARDLCPNARYISADGGGGIGSLYTFSCR